MTSAIATTIGVPDITQLADEELQNLFRNLDGAWSAQTQALMRRFRIDRLQLDENWAGLPQNWQCPACQRWKPEIVRVTPNGVLLCQLVNHHDHTGDLVKRRVAKNGLPSEGRDRTEVLKAVELCRPLAERFWPTMICGDCNIAEGQAKVKLAGTIDPDFSFSPVEIARFVRAKPNAAHEIDVEVAKALWTEISVDYEQRLALIDYLVERVLTGGLNKQGSRYSQRGGSNSRDLLYIAATAGWEGRSAIYALGTEMSRRSVVRQGLGSGCIRPRPTKTISDAEFAAFDAAQGPATWWRCVAVQWRCAVCDRTRRETVRRSNSGRLTGELFRIWGYLPETNPTSLEYRAFECEPVFGAAFPLILCQDCRHMISLAKTRDPDCDEAAYSARSLARLIQSASPNQMHLFDLDEVVRYGQRNFEYRSSVQAFRAHGLEASQAFYAVKSHSNYFRIDFESAVAEVAAEWAEGQDASLMAYEAQRLGWLIDEHRRLTKDSAEAEAKRPRRVE